MVFSWCDGELFLFYLSRMRISMNGCYNLIQGLKLYVNSKKKSIDWLLQILLCMPFGEISL